MAVNLLSCVTIFQIWVWKDHLRPQGCFFIKRLQNADLIQFGSGKESGTVAAAGFDEIGGRTPKMVAGLD